MRFAAVGLPNHHHTPSDYGDAAATCLDWITEISELAIPFCEVSFLAYHDFMSTQLNHYRLLGRSGLRVSPLCLGTMTFGEDWGWGASKDESLNILNLYAEKGGNFIDTANIYTNGTSETLLGEFLQDRRDQFVLATKFTFSMRNKDPNASGNHRKNIRQSVEASLKRLRTDHIDLYWQHAWDKKTPIDETMRALDDLVVSGKVLYVGISDMPAWKVSQANTLADFRGWAPFVGFQIEYSLIERTPERDLLPMALDLNLGVTPWSPLGQGVLTGKFNGGQADPKARIGDPNSQHSQRYLNDRTLKIAGVVIEVAKEIGRSPAQIALAWLLHQGGVASPIIGGRKIKQIEDNLAAVEVDLNESQLKRLDDASRIEMGFPHDFLNMQFVKDMMTGNTMVE
jgi:aryl-alcohol dehydrogenase-like predicted oxidoreductase